MEFPNAEKKPWTDSEHMTQYYEIPKTGTTWGLDMPTQQVNMVPLRVALTT